ncbi:MAG: hypothetical protein ACTSRC_17255 [Candidatus Helarchaeota archaeon]
MPTEQELKNELFKLREQLMKKEEEIKQIKLKMADIEKQLGIAQVELAAPIPDVAGIQGADSPKEELMPTTASAPVVRKPKAILQKVPTSGTSQLHARETQFECPNCGSRYNMEVEDKSRILYVVGAGTRIYAKKHRCMNCGNEWAD